MDGSTEEPRTFFSTILGEPIKKSMLEKHFWNVPSL
jgi:hypothetical protein